MNPKSKTNVVLFGTILTITLILLIDFVSSEQSLISTPITQLQAIPSVSIIELREGNVCIKEKNNKGNTEITDITEPLTMVEISQVLSQTSKNNVKQCFKITKEYTKENNKIIKSELKTISKK